MMKHLTLVCAFLATTSSALIAACGDPCGNDVVSETNSPDGKFKVVVFERDCGATTGFSTQVSILSSSQSSTSDKGNTFIADDNKHAVPLSDKGAMEIKVHWESDSSVSISYPQKAEVFLKKSSVVGVAIRYEAVP